MAIFASEIIHHHKFNQRNIVDGVKPTTLLYHVPLLKLRPIAMSNLIRILIIIINIISCVPSIYAEKFRVTDEYVTVYSDPERTTKVGRVYRGDVYEALGIAGTMYIFEFKGRKAYVATYCCKKVEEPESAVKQNGNKQQNHNVSTRAVVSNKPTSSEQISEITTSTVASESETSKNYFKWIDDLERKRNSLANTDMPRWMSTAIGLMIMLSMFIGIWTLFGTRSFNNFFDRLAGAYISSPSKATYFRPLIIIFGSSAVYYITLNYQIALISAAIYEIILLLKRSKKLGGLRPAIVEAFYLLFYGMGTILLCWMHLIKFFLAAGAASSSSSGKNVNRICGRCEYYIKDIPTDKCRMHRTTINPNDDACDSFRCRS